MIAYERVMSTFLGRPAETVALDYLLAGLREAVEQPSLILPHEELP